MKHEKSKHIKIIYLLLIIIAIRVVMLTQSRTGFVGIMAFGFFVWLYSKKKMLSLVAIIISAILIWNFAPQQTRDRFLTFRDVDKVISGEYTEVEAGSMAARWTMMKHALTVFIENPVIGVGLDNYKVASFRKWRRWIPPHNTYLQALAEMGLIGTIAFFSVILMTLRNLNKAQLIVGERKEGNTFLYYLIYSLKVHLLARLVVSFFGIELYDNYWWLIGGLSIVLLRVARQERPLTHQ